ncbi:disease resistance protein Roq1-like [Trifolium pratense]|uniref:disease resistance protein Roq1-like n=1 Tax=Trifolium pratense TaxID=57577 RepID=UPI001E693C8B|nr:disease resistance protein Roq1-like [Trifolium pratense]
MATMKELKPQSSSSFTHEWVYDVFLSFRGEDTRKGFTGNLYNALCEKGINTFIDDKELRKGEEIKLALMTAIQQSRAAIVIFSENYASSTYCLEELTKIMECIKRNGRLVWPVFYQVDPSDVRHQKGSYAEALANHEREKTIDKEKVKQWRSALEEAANLSGWHFKHGYEYELIEEIVKEVSKKINRRPLHVAKYPVGLVSRVQKLNSLLEIESDEVVQMVGIFGMGGLGKTTLACAVYNCIADRFDSLCFLANVRDNSKKYGLVQVQEMLLSELAGEKDLNLCSLNKGISIIKSRLSGKKILLILDDVDRLEQLEALAGGLDWFGSGSRVIITTRNKHLLHVQRIERVYELEGLKDGEALELFAWNAFKTKEIDPSYVDISKRAVRYSNGLPLSVEIIGSDLYGKTKSEWKSALDTYERIPHDNIQEILRVSYDGLKEFEKEIFLDIACFFKGYKLSDVANILTRGRGFNPDYAIQVLIDKSLIKIDHCHVRIHDMIEDMGREIVRLESASKPGERSRLWFSTDILHVFKENKGSDKTEVIMLRLLKDKEVQWDGNALKKMENLKILVIEKAHFSRGPTHLPKSLKVLKWCDYPESSLPAHYDPKKLVILDLSMGLFTFGKQKIMEFKSLTEMKLSKCQSLKKVPDMSGAPNLKKLHLDSCKRLVKVHDSVGFLGKLEDLNLNGCTGLKILPRGINLPSLKTMSLRNCKALKNFPEILGKMENITYLVLSDSGICDLPFSIGLLVGLANLAIDRCNNLLELPSSIFMLPELKALEAYSCKGLARIKKGKGQLRETSSDVKSVVEFSFCHLSDEKSVVDFSFCHLSDEFLVTLLPCFHCVTNLSLDYSSITILPSCINACHSLEELTLNNCTALREIRDLPPNIKHLSAINCTSLTSQSKKMLLNKMLPNSGTKYICFPGSTIPSWFHENRQAPSMSFKFRKKLPLMALSVAVVAGGCYCSKCCLKCDFDLIINGSKRLTNFLHVSWSKTNAIDTNLNHIILLDLQLKASLDMIGKLRIMNGWNHAEISLVKHSGQDMKWMRLHVQEQKTSMADIQIINPKVTIEGKEKKNVTCGDKS